MKTLLTLLFATLAITSVRADVQSDLAAFGQVLNDVNKGFMAALTEDPDSLSTDCVERSEASGVEIEKLFDTTTYYDDQFSIGALLKQGQIVVIKIMDQFNHCNFNAYLVNLDNMFSKIPELSGMGANVIAEVVVYFASG